MSDSHNAARHSRSAGGSKRSQRIGARVICVVVTVCIGTVTNPKAGGSFQSSLERAALDQPALTDAQSLFYNARYEAAAGLALAVRVDTEEDLANDELRSSALLFQLKALLQARPHKEDALTHCATCPNLIAEFLADIHRGHSAARTTLRSPPDDETALFFLGKLNSPNSGSNSAPCAGRPVETSTRKRGGPSMRWSHTIRDTCARALHGPGSITSSTPKCPGEPVGCWVAAIESTR